MCKMMAMRSQLPMTDIERYAHKEWQWGNRDGVGVYTDTTGLKRYRLTAEYIPLKEYYTTMLYHVRQSTGGKGTHPFVSENGRYYLIQNGWLINYDKLKRELINRGHVFKTEIDSEVLLHLFEECKKSKKHPIKTLLKRLAMWNVNGKLNFIVYDSKSDKLYVFSDGFLEYIYTPNHFFWVATEFDTWACESIEKLTIELREGEYLVVKKCRIIESGTVENNGIGVSSLTKPDVKTVPKPRQSRDLTINHYNLMWGKKKAPKVKFEKKKWRGKQ